MGLIKSPRHLIAPYLLKYLGVSKSTLCGFFENDSRFSPQPFSHCARRCSPDLGNPGSRSVSTTLIMRNSFSSFENSRYSNDYSAIRSATYVLNSSPSASSKSVIISDLAAPFLIEAFIRAYFLRFGWWRTNHSTVRSMPSSSGVH